ncbi:hypothetical protein [Noviluteimonas dokdonensis]|uniref:hypothetical protein n=1 Tax=Noviluteimonas dokdonensis TaxID=414050 RepID=UPI00126A2DD5|nr:hypothetical protein [Lysobacter dokdonensis]
MTKSVRNFSDCTADSILELNEAVKFVCDRIRRDDERDRNAEWRARAWLRETWPGAKSFQLGDLIDRALKRNDEWRAAFEACDGKWRDPAKATVAATLGEMTLRAEAHQVLHTFEQSQAALDDALVRLAAAEAEKVELRSAVATYKTKEAERASESESQRKKAKRERKV